MRILKKANHNARSRIYFYKIIYKNQILNDQKPFAINLIPLKHENDPIINSQEPLNSDSNSVASNSCRGDSCNPDIFDESEIIPALEHSGDGENDQTENSVLTDDEELSVPPVIQVINLEKSKNFTSTLSPTKLHPSTTVNISESTTLSTTRMVIHTTEQPTELLNITADAMPTTTTTEENLVRNTTVSLTPPTTKTTTTLPPTTTSTTTTTEIIPKQEMHVWIQGGDGFGDSAKVFQKYKNIRISDFSVDGIDH